MSDMPERISAWAWNNHTQRGQWSTMGDLAGEQDYIRADLHDAVTAERDALRAENERPREALRVKPLMWQTWQGGRFQAESILGRYVTWDGHWRLDGRDGRGRRADDPEAAAQADYERHIRAALGDTDT